MSEGNRVNAIQVTKADVVIDEIEYCEKLMEETYIPSQKWNKSQKELRNAMGTMLINLKSFMDDYYPKEFR